MNTLVVVYTKAACPQGESGIAQLYRSSVNLPKKETILVGQENNEISAAQLSPAPVAAGTEPAQCQCTAELVV